MLSETLGQAPLLADVHRLQPDVPADDGRSACWACRAASRPTRTTTAGTSGTRIATIGAFMIAVSILVFIYQRHHQRCATARSPATTRGTRARWSGRSRRRRRRTTSRRSRRCTRSTTSGTGSTPRTRRACRSRSPQARRTHGGHGDGHGDGHGIHLPSPSYHAADRGARHARSSGSASSTTHALVAVGAAVLVVGLYLWVLEPATEE